MAAQLQVYLPAILASHLIALLFVFGKQALALALHSCHLLRKLMQPAKHTNQANSSSGSSNPKRCPANKPVCRKISPGVRVGARRKHSSHRAVAQACEGGSGAAAPSPLTSSITWHNLCVSVSNGGGHCVRPLINVSGAAVVGKMQAVIGPSGAGKSTLLELLARGPPRSSISHANSSPTEAGPGHHHTRSSWASSSVQRFASGQGRKTSSLFKSSRMTVTGRIEIGGRCIFDSEVDEAEASSIHAKAEGHKRSLTRMQCGRVCYIPQEDVLVPTLTVGEAAVFAHQMASAGKGSLASRDAPRAILERLGLADLWDTKIGGLLVGGTSLRGISGGERKRLAIALSLLSMPPPPCSDSHNESGVPAGMAQLSTTLLVDEPTSGLDSTSALSVMMYLRGLAMPGSIGQQHGAEEGVNEGTAVVATIHQPRPLIWAQFDLCTVLAKGSMVFFGPCDMLVQFFEQNLSRGLLPPYCPDRHGAVPDYVGEILAGSIWGGTTPKGEEASSAGARGKARKANRGGLQAPVASCAHGGLAGMAATSVAAVLQQSGQGTQQPGMQQGSIGVGNSSSCVRRKASSGMHSGQGMQQPGTQQGCTGIGNSSCVRRKVSKGHTQGFPVRRRNSPGQAKAARLGSSIKARLSGSEAAKDASPTDASDQVLETVHAFQREAAEHLHELMRGPSGLLWWQPAPGSASKSSHSGSANPSSVNSGGAKPAGAHEELPNPALLTAPESVLTYNPCDLKQATIAARSILEGEGALGYLGAGGKNRGSIATELLQLPGHKSYLLQKAGVDQDAASVSSGMLATMNAADSVVSASAVPEPDSAARASSSRTSSSISIISCPGAKSHTPTPPAPSDRILLTPSSSSMSSISVSNPACSGCGLAHLFSPTSRPAKQSHITQVSCPCRHCRRSPPSFALTNSCLDPENLTSTPCAPTKPPKPANPQAGVTASLSIACSKTGHVQASKYHDSTASGNSKSNSSSSSSGRVRSWCGGAVLDLQSGVANACQKVQRSSRRLWQRVYVTWRHFCLLTWREYLGLTSNPIEPAMKLLMFCWAAVVMGLVFYDLGSAEGFMEVRLRLSSLLMSSGVLISMPFMSMLAYTADTAHAVKEAADGLYGPLPYFGAKVAATVPLNVLCSATYAIVLYGMQGLRMTDHPGNMPDPSMQQKRAEEGGYGTAVLVQGNMEAPWGGGAAAIACQLLLSIGLVLVSSQLMHLAVVAAPGRSSDMAFALTTLWAVVNLFFSGFFISPEQLHIQDLAPLKYFSAVRLAFQGAAILELKGRNFACDAVAATLHAAAAPSGQRSEQASPVVIQSIAAALGLDPSYSAALLPAIAQDGNTDNGSTVGNSSQERACTLSGDALIAFFGFGTTLETSTYDGAQPRLELVGSAIDPWSHVGSMVAYYAALICTTFGIIWYKWPKVRPGVSGSR